MTFSWITWLTLALTVSSGLIAGVFLTFSDFVMNGLRASANTSGIEAMQMINRTVYQSVFMVLFIGLALASVGVLTYAVIFGFGTATTTMISGALTYLIGVFAVTAAFNVPMNTRLDGFDPAGVEAAKYWTEYVRRWTNWNHIRTIASTLAMVLFMSAAMQMGSA